VEPGIPIKDRIGTATMDYTVLEMEVALGDTVEGGIKLKGWVWCTHPPPWIGKAGYPRRICRC